MDFNLSEEAKKLVEFNKVDQAILLAENELKKIPLTDFHKVLGRDFLNLTDNLIEFITYFYKEASNEIKVKAIYSEMNGFTINYELWFLDLFAFKNCEGLEDTDWLADFEFSIEESMVLNGLEDIQAVFEDYMKNERWEDENLEKAMEVCEIIIVLRLQELFKSTVERATQKQLEWCSIPIFATAHDYEILYSTNL